MTYRFESLIRSGFWIEVWEIANSLTEYGYRSSLSVCIDSLPFFPGENFESLLTTYRDLYSTWREVNLGTPDVSAPVYVEDFTKPVEPKKCDCDIKDLLKKGCSCGGL